MEIIIILVLIAVAAIFVYFQLQGSRPEVTPEIYLGTGSKKSPKKSQGEKRVVTEQWDKAEVKTKDSEESPKKKKERFDPVAQGKKITKSETLRKREVKAVAEEQTQEEVKEGRRNRDRLANGGFVIIEEKKVVAKKASGDEVEAKPVVEEKVLTEFELRIKRLREVVEGKPADRPDGDRPRRKDEAPKEAVATGAPSANDNAKMLEKVKKFKDEQKGQKKTGVSGLQIKSSAPAAAPVAAGGVKRGWERPAAPKAEVAAPEPEKEEAAAPEPVVEAEADFEEPAEEEF